jgi:hypothetical protein
MKGDEGRAKILEALSALSNAEPSHDHYEMYRRETHGEKNDRGAAILMATNLENALQSAIVSHLQLRSSQRRELFKFDSPMGTFENKIRIAAALKIIGPITRKNIEVIKAIRNAFAHAKIPITFKDAEVTAACKLLTWVSVQTTQIGRVVKPSPEVDAALVGKLRFRMVCENTASNFIQRTIRPPILIATEAIRKVINADFDGYEVVARLEPLP